MTCCTGAPARRYPSTGGPKIRLGDLSTASQTSVFNLEQKEDHAESHFKTLGLYNFTRDFGWACKRGSLYPAGGLISGIKKNLSEQRDKTYLRNELKLRYHYILSYIYNIFIVRYNKQRMYLKNIYKTDLCDCLKQTQKEHTYTVAGLINRGAYIQGGLYPGGLISRGAYIQGGLYPGGLISGWAYIQGGLYPGGLISGWAYIQVGLYPGGLISRGAYIQGGLYPGGLISRGAYIQGGLYPGGLISRWAYIQGGLYPGGLISRGAYIQGGLYPGGLISRGAYFQVGLYPEYYIRWQMDGLQGFSNVFFLLIFGREK